MADRSEKKVELAQLPEWIRILPLGKVELSDSREPFEVDAASLSSMAAGFRSRGVDLVIDYEHQSLQGERAPAAGWIKDLEARTDGLWAKVEWTRQAREYLLNKEYRYFSPVLRLDPASRRPTALLHLGLTNVPAIKHLAPLVAKWGGEAETVGVAVNPEAQSPGEERGKSMEKIREWLGLGLDVKDEAVASRMLEFLGDLAASLNLPREASLSQLKGAVADRLAGLQVIGLLHDLGKISVPAEILSKPGKLSETEFAIIKFHAQAGYDIVKEIRFPWPVAEVILQHHERMDGSGYPKGLTGPDIILEARILAVADVVEAMASHRPYRPALGIESGLEEIAQKKGILYDPEVVDACLKLCTEKGFQFA